MAAKLKASVGKRGKNNPDDVKIVQQLIKPFCSKLGVSAPKVDGKPSSTLEKAIGKFQEDICQFRPDFTVDPGKRTIKKLIAGPAKAEAEKKAREKADQKAKDDQQKKMLAEVKKTAEKEAKAQGLDSKSAKKMLAEMEAYATSQWDSMVAKVEKAAGGVFDLKSLVKGSDDVVKGATSGNKSIMSSLLEDLTGGGESGPGAKVPLILSGSETDIKKLCFTFRVSGKSPDPKAKVMLLLEGQAATAVDITKGWNKVAMVEVFKKLEAHGLWGKTVKFHAAETTDGKIDMATLSKPVSLKTPVAPFKGTVSYSGIGADKNAIYTGNGKGRYLYTTKINGWYFFKYGPDFERDAKMRGFDCITFVGSANKTERGMAGRGDGLASHLGASKIDMEGKTKDEVVEFFKGDGKSGEYIAWWSTHCIAVLNGTVHEYSQSKGGYRSMAATAYGWKSSGNYVRKL